MIIVPLWHRVTAGILILALGGVVAYKLGGAFAGLAVSLAVILATMVVAWYWVETDTG